MTLVAGLFAPGSGCRAAKAAAVLCFLLSGCGFLPGYGPTAMDIALQDAEEAQKTEEYLVVALDGAAISAQELVPFAPLPSEFNGSMADSRDATLGVGDQLMVNIWEASSDGLFSTIENKQVSLTVAVDANGQVFIPYAGRIRATGRSVESLRQAIEAGLTGKAIEPQVQVLQTGAVSSSIVVVGDVAKPGHYQLAIRGLRLLEAIAEAGGTLQATFESIATVTRGTLQATLRLDEIISHPERNIWLMPGDNVLILHRPRSYAAFGAVTSSQLVPFKAETVTLAEALAQVGGLRDMAADPGGVFLFRFETEELARLLSPAPLPARSADAPQGALLPVIYRLDFNQPQAFFHARSFKMRDKDIVYVANHPTAEFSKFLSTIVSPIFGTTRTVTTLSN